MLTSHVASSALRSPSGARSRPRIATDEFGSAASISSAASIRTRRREVPPVVNFERRESENLGERCWRVARKTAHSCCPDSCGLFVAFVVFGLVVVPLAVFGVAGVFAALLWQLECNLMKEELGADSSENEDSAEAGRRLLQYLEGFSSVSGSICGIFS